MVYESDFYTTRRPYSRPSPTISSYSVTAQPLRSNLPFVAHKRLTTPQAPPPRSKVRNAVLRAEIDRINHRVRPHPAYVPTEDWLNSACSVVHPYPQFSPAKLMRFAVLPLSYKMHNLDSAVPERFNLRHSLGLGCETYLESLVPVDRFRYEYADNFDDETRSIRAQTAALLKRVHSPIPRSRGPLHAVLPTPSSLMETPVPHRHTSDYYIEGLLGSVNKVHRDVASRSFYVEHPRPYIGKGNLACVSFAGGKAYNKRRGHYDVPEDHHNVQDDIATLSYYNRARAVANGQEPGPEPAAATTRKSRPYKSTTDSAPAPKAAAAPAPAPAAAPEPIRTASVKEDPAAEAAAEAELAAEAQAPVTNGVSAEEDEAAKLAAEEAELERQLEAEMRAEMEAKEAKKAKKAAAKKAKDDEDAKKAAEEAEAKRQAEEAAAAAAAAAEAAAAAAAEAEAAAASAAAAAAAEAAAEAARKAAEEEAEIERQVAAELEAEAKKAAEEVLAAAAAEPEEEVSNVEAVEAEAEATPENEAEAVAYAEPEVAVAEEVEPEPEPIPEPETVSELEPASEPEPEVVAEEPEPETAASPEPEAIAEDDPVVEEPASEAVQDEVEGAKSDEDAGWPLDEE